MMWRALSRHLQQWLPGKLVEAALGRQAVEAALGLRVVRSVITRWQDCAVANHPCA